MFWEGSQSIFVEDFTWSLFLEPVISFAALFKTRCNFDIDVLVRPYSICTVCCRRSLVLKIQKCELAFLWFYYLYIFDVVPCIRFDHVDRMFHVKLWV